MTTAQTKTQRGFWRLAWERFSCDKIGMASLMIVMCFVVTVVLALFGAVAGNWHKEIGIPHAPPDFWGLASPEPPGDGASAEANPFQADPMDPADWNTSVIDPLEEVLQKLRGSLTITETGEARRASLPLGGDRWGRDVLLKTIKGSQTSILVGLTAALLATLLGALAGAFAGYYGGFADNALNWIYNVLNAIPYLLLILAVAAVLQKRGVMTIVLILGLTGWTGVFRLVRAEYIRHRTREYALAARAFGAPSWRVMFLHILPNVSHILLVELSLLTVGFIKSEVILSFLGFGVAVDEVSWGSMLNEAQTELILGRWWELAAATAAMALLVTAFSLLTDALRDALDPKMPGKQGGAS
jgi:peptide/nickel transport system permease protein